MHVSFDLFIPLQIHCANMTLPDTKHIQVQDQLPRALPDAYNQPYNSLPKIYLNTKNLHDLALTKDNHDWILLTKEFEINKQCLYFSYGCIPKSRGIPEQACPLMFCSSVSCIRQPWFKLCLLPECLNKHLFFNLSIK